MENKKIVAMETRKKEFTTRKDFPKKRNRLCGSWDLGLYSRVSGSWMRFVTNNAPIRFFSDDGAGTDANMTIEANGNVGIGTTDPNYKLDVCGTIRSKEWIVETGWCDFVFDNDFKRMTWQEKEKYYSSNKHLMGIASGKEIEKNGLKTGKTMKGMIFNIEENSLDIIDIFKESQKQKKQIEALEKENQKLQSDIEWLKEKMLLLEK